MYGMDGVLIILLVGALFFGLPIAILIQISKLRSENEKLADLVRKLEQRLNIFMVRKEKAGTMETPPQLPLTFKIEVNEPARAVVDTKPESQPPAVTMPAEKPVVVTPIKPPPIEKVSSVEEVAAQKVIPPAEQKSDDKSDILARAWNWLIVGKANHKPGESLEFSVATNWLLRVGILLVLSGVAYLLKYSIEKGFIGPMGRVVLCVIAGIALIWGGLRLLFKKYHLLGQGLAGAGFIILYFAFFAASNLYKLVPQPAAFALMAVVTVAAGIVAVAYKTTGIAIVGIIGGYVTPLLVGSSDTSPYFFYGYLLMLGIGVLVLSLAGRCPPLNILSMVAGYVLMFRFSYDHTDPADLYDDLIVISMLHLLYLFSVVIWFMRKRVATTALEWVALLMNSAFYWFWILLQFKPAVSIRVVGLLSVSMAIIYGLLAFFVIRKKNEDKLLLPIYLMLAVTFLAMSPVLLLESNWFTLFWCVQAVAVFFIARAVGLRFLYQLGSVVIVLACLRGLTFDLYYFYFGNEHQALIGKGFWVAAALRVGVLGAVPAAVLIIRRLITHQPLVKFMLGLGLSQIWLTLSFEAHLIADTYTPDFAMGAITLVWALFAFGLIFAGMLWRGIWLRRFGLILFMVSAAKLLIIDLAWLETVYRIIACIITGVLFVAGSFIYLKYRSIFEPPEMSESGV